MESEAKNRMTSWINEVFTSKNFSILNVEYPDYDNKGGYVADIVYANVRAQKSNREELFELIIKQSKDNKFLLETLNMRQAYINELNLYSKILPYIQKLAEKYKTVPFENIPHCYGAIEKDNNYLVFLENLKVKGYKTRELTSPQDLHHATLVLQAYAKWHALCLAAAQKNPHIFKEMGSVNPMVEGSKGFELMTQSIFKETDDMIRMYDSKEKSHITERLNKFRKTILQLFIDSVNNVNEKYLVFRHGDCWNNNFLFLYEDGEVQPEKVVIIDWQLTAPASPVCDVVQYLFSSTSKQVLEQIDELLLPMYHSCLSEKLKELDCNPEETFPWEACQKSFTKYAPIGIMGIPMFAKMRDNVERSKNYDLSQLEQDGDFTGLLGKTLSNPDKYFEQVDSLLELCYERGYF